MLYVALIVDYRVFDSSCVTVCIVWLRGSCSLTIVLTAFAKRWIGLAWQKGGMENKHSAVASSFCHARQGSIADKSVRNFGCGPWWSWWRSHRYIVHLFETPSSYSPKDQCHVARVVASGCLPHMSWKVPRKIVLGFCLVRYLKFFHLHFSWKAIWDASRFLSKNEWYL